MKFNVFDVVELNSGNNATIKDIKKGSYLVEVCNQNGTIKEVKTISGNEISKTLWSKTAI